MKLNEVIELAQDYCAAEHPDTCEIAGFIAWISTNQFRTEMDFGESLDLVEAKLKQ